jgi:hypothetical protein
MWGPGKTTYTFSVMFRFLLRPFSMLPAGGEGVGQAAETESTLAIAENVYVNLPRPLNVSHPVRRFKQGIVKGEVSLYH